MDQSWHPEHFQCYGCLVVFSDNMSYREKVLWPTMTMTNSLSSKVWFSLKPWTLQDTRPYCEHCYQDTVLPKCGGCRWRSKIRKGSILKSHISETRSQTRLLKLSTSTGTPSALSARWVIHNRSHVMEHTVLKFYCYFVMKDCKKNFEDGSSFYSMEGKPMCGKCAGADE